MGVYELLTEKILELEKMCSIKIRRAHSIVPV